MKPRGALLVGAVRSFWESGNERPCTLGCTLGIYVPSVVVAGLLGTVVGAVIDPPSGRWMPIWGR